MEVALAFVVSTAEAQNSNNGGDEGDDGYDAQAVQELLEWRKRLGEETKELDPGSAVDGKSGRRARYLPAGGPRPKPLEFDEHTSPHIPVESSPLSQNLEQDDLRVPDLVLHDRKHNSKSHARNFC